MNREDATSPVSMLPGTRLSGSSSISTSAHSMQYSADATRNKARGLQDLVDEMVHGDLSDEDVTSRCQELGVSLVELKDVVDKAEHRRRVRFEKSRDRDNAPGDPDDESTSPDRSPKPRESEDHRGSASHRSQPPADDSVVANEEVARRLLSAKIRALRQLSQPTSSQDLVDLLDLLTHDDDAQSFSIPSFVLAGAPHLANASLPAMDTLLQESVKLRQLFSTDKIINSVVSTLRLRPMRDPLPSSVWKLIVRDEYVDFEKLHAGLDPSYDQNDDIKRLQGDYSIIKTDSISSKKKIVSETEWSRVFRAWSSGVTAVYPHRSKELEEYEVIISEIFHSWPSRPTVAIQTDSTVRKNYAKSPFRLDDRQRIQVPILSQFSAVIEPSSTPKRSSTMASGSPTKRQTVPCENWSLGKCTDPCMYRRKHDICCKCQGNHRARDMPECLAHLQARRNSRVRSRGRTSDQGSSRS